MASIVVLSGSPSSTSRTAALTEHLAERLREREHTVRVVRIRDDLPAEALIGADATDPAIAEVVGAIKNTDGLLVASPIYKAAYTGVLKTLLDLLPHMVLAGKIVQPLLTGAGQVHALALDYALRPVLAALGPYHILPGIFVVDKEIDSPETETKVHQAIDLFSEALVSRVRG